MPELAPQQLVQGLQIANPDLTRNHRRRQVRALQQMLGQSGPPRAQEGDDRAAHDGTEAAVELAMADAQLPGDGGDAQPGGEAQLDEIAGLGHQGIAGLARGMPDHLMEDVPQAHRRLPRLGLQQARGRAQPLLDDREVAPTIDQQRNLHGLAGSDEVGIGVGLLSAHAVAHHRPGWRDASRTRLDMQVFSRYFCATGIRIEMQLPQPGQGVATEPGAMAGHRDRHRLRQVAKGQGMHAQNLPVVRRLGNRRLAAGCDAAGMTALPAIDTAAFARDGYLVLRRQIQPARIAAMQAALTTEVADILDGLKRDGLIGDTRPDLPWERRLAIAGEHTENHGRSWTERLAVPATFDLHHDLGLLAALHQLLGPVVNGHRQFNVRPKLPGQDLTTVPWHQDTGYYGAHTARDLIITAWVPLVPVDAGNGCMQVIPGSHREGAVPHVDANDAGKFLRVDTRVDESRAVTLAMEPGDVLLMHNLVFHRSTDNHSDGIRWSIDLRFWRPDTPCADSLLSGFPAPWVVSGAPATPVETWMDWYPA